MVIWREDDESDSVLKLKKDDILFEVSDDDNIFITAKAFYWILKMKYRYDKTSLYLISEADRLIPLEERLMRKALHSQLLRWRNKQKIKQYIPKYYSPYKMYSYPSFYTFFSTEYRKSDNTRYIGNNILILGRNDIFYLDAIWGLNINRGEETYLIYDEKKTTSNIGATFRLEKQVPYIRHLPFGLKKIAIGDVYSPSILDLSPSFSGRGIFLSWKNKKEYNIFDKVVIDGNIRPNWEVDVFRNGGLIDFGKSDNFGRYN
jgi:hypothetical protein